jgi:hypothetical protein
MEYIKSFFHKATQEKPSRRSPSLLPELVLPGWYLIRHDNAFPVMPEENVAATRFSLMHREKQEAFADEIFRVFQQRYANIKIIPINMVDPVKFMVDRVEKPS